MNTDNFNPKQQAAQQMPIIVSKPIVYGTISFWQGKKADEKHTHKWCAFVRSPHNEDLSNFIQSVTFVLHPSFENHERVVQQHPFEIAESGWGEFEILIKIQFKVEQYNPPMEIYHQLKLYHSNSAPQSTKKPVISEFYDEIVFVNPSNQFQEILNKVTYKELILKQASSSQQQQQLQLQSLTQNGQFQQQIQQQQQPQIQQQLQTIPSPLKMEEENTSQNNEKEEEALNDYQNYYTKFDPSEHKQKLDDALQIIKIEVERLTQEAKVLDDQILNLYKQSNQNQGL